MEVIRNQEFLLLPVDEVAKLLASDDLNVPSEENIFHVSIDCARNLFLMKLASINEILQTNYINLPI